MKSIKVMETMDRVAKEAGGPGVTGKGCPLCGRSYEAAVDPDRVPETFRDTLSLREAEISQMCQECQDTAFDDDDLEGW